MSVFPTTAAFSGLCPSCGKYIRAGRSGVASLGVAFPPNPEHTIYTREGWHIAGAAGSIRTRRWLHEVCAERLDRLSIEELEQLADDWKAELQAKRRLAADELGRRYGGSSRGQRRQAVTS